MIRVEYDFCIDPSNKNRVSSHIATKRANSMVAVIGYGHLVETLKKKRKIFKVVLDYRRNMIKICPLCMIKKIIIIKRKKKINVVLHLRFLQWMNKSLKYNLVKEGENTILTRGPQNYPLK